MVNPVWEFMRECAADMEDGSGSEIASGSDTTD